MLKAFILCAGNGARWGNYLGHKKQHIVLDGETLISRSLRLLKKNGVTENYIVTHDIDLMHENSQQLSPQQYSCIAETLNSCSRQWANRNIVLLGDVFYTEAALKKIIHSKCNIHFFGRPWPSRYTGCVHGEIFAITFNKNSVNDLHKHIVKAIAHFQAGGLGNLWNIYQSLTKSPFDSKVRENTIFQVIDDFTEDFDTPKDYDRSAHLCNRYAKYNLLMRILLVVYCNLLDMRYLFKIPQKKYLNQPVPWKIKD